MVKFFYFLTSFTSFDNCFWKLLLLLLNWTYWMIWNIPSSNSFSLDIFGADSVDLKPIVSLFSCVILGFKKKSAHSEA